MTLLTPNFKSYNRLMETQNIYDYPQNIICLTEESVETLFLLGRGELVKGVSAFVKRPVEAQKLPKVSQFTNSNYKKILEKKPDLILGHSDIQKDIARDLIELGQNVYIANHRTIQGILQYIYGLAKLVDAKDEGKELIESLISRINKAKKFAKTLQNKPKVYFEEWDGPLISGIKWVSELIELCGGIDIHREQAQAVLAKDRTTTHEKIIEENPDIIFGCWCGKKVSVSKIKKREGYDKINAVKKNRVFELPPEIFLQPGPAPILDGIDLLISFFEQFNKEEMK